jgi:AraC family transcriptional regulator of adaptative response/methylated-DNA-[protein]-cysteine methyltransferase
VTDALYDAGFASSSRFYENVTASLGMKPSEVRNGALRTRIHFAIRPSYLGWVLIAATERGICAIEFGETAEILRERLRAGFPKAELQEGDPEFDTAVARVLEFLGAPLHGLDLPLDIQGTAFQRRVWLALQVIPAGSTESYAEIAARLGSPKAARAVAQACAANRLAVAIPCHRAVRSDGSLGGYRWGAQRKRSLLQREVDGLQQQHRVAEGEETIL